MPRKLLTSLAGFPGLDLAEAGTDVTNGTPKRSARRRLFSSSSGSTVAWILGTAEAVSGLAVPNFSPRFCFFAASSAAISTLGLISNRAARRASLFAASLAVTGTSVVVGSAVSVGIAGAGGELTTGPGPTGVGLVSTRGAAETETGVGAAFAGDAAGAGVALTGGEAGATAGV